jgi:Spy/CpxP family protein refolding chaperone
MANRKRTDEYEDRRATLTRRALRMGVSMAALLGAALLGAAFLPSVTANAHAGFAGGHGGWRHGDPAERAEHAVGWILRWVDGTPEQQEQITTIVVAALEDVRALREQHREQSRAFMAEMSKPTIDRAAIEELRQEGLGLAEVGSRRLVEGLADAAEALTPEQRNQLVELVERFHEH